MISKRRRRFSRKRLVLIGTLVLGVFLFSLWLSSEAWAQSKRSFRRQAILQWEQVPGALKYDVQVTPVDEDGDEKGKKLKFTVNESIWKARLLPGYYKLKIRSYDKRGVPGKWSPPLSTIVTLENATPVEPKQNAQIKTVQDTEYPVKFAWKKVRRAYQYRVEIRDDAGNVVAAENTDDTDIEIDLKVAEKYSWRVVPLLRGQTQIPDEAGESNFVVHGNRLQPPEINDLDPNDLEHLSWEASDHADSYRWRISYFDEDKKKWSTVSKAKGHKETKAPFEKPKMGRYRIQVQATGEYRGASPMAMREFPINEDVMRGPAAVRDAQLRDSIEKPTNFYVIASYLATQVTYSGIHQEFSQTGQGKKINYTGIGGTGRLGLGYHKPKSKWGVFGILDYSGIVVDGTNFTYSSAELHLVWRNFFFNRLLWKTDGGIFYREIPYTREKSIGSQSFQTDAIAMAGPHLGGLAWYPITTKMGLQFEGRFYYNMLGLKTPNGGDFQPTLSYAFGLFGSYKLYERLTGFLGVTYKVDNGEFKATPEDPNNPNPESFAPEGSINSVELQGLYLNMKLEWGF